MSGFDADWLALRAAADEAARARATERLMGLVPSISREMHVVDVGAGSGNNGVHLAPWFARRGAERQRWALVDDDATLLDRASGRLRALDLDLDVEVVRCDLARDLERVPFGGADVVTCSALLDLVSRPWLMAFADAVRAADVPAVLAALTVDGRVEWSPPHPFDGRATAAFHADMRRDKGLGPALAEDACDAFTAALMPRGYRIERVASPWTLGAADAALQRRYLDDVATVVARREPGDETAAWRNQRAAWIDDGSSTLVVGHRDLLATLVDFD